MKILILNPKKISYKKNYENFFLNNFFLKLKKYRFKKLNYHILNKKDISKKIQLFQIKFTKKISRDILREIVPKLNNIHNIKWNLKTWDFFVGLWIHSYVYIIFDRLNLIKKIKKKINLNEQLIIGRDAPLISNDFGKFHEYAGKIDWNEKLISRLIYLIKSKDFNNTESILNSQKFLKPKNLPKINIIILNLVITFFKILSFFLINKKSFVFFNSYIKSKYKLCKIIFNLGSVPFPYSFTLFNSLIIQCKINPQLRKKIKLNFKKEKNIKLKIIKFLFNETFPLIYLEGFLTQKRIADKSHLPKNIKGVFTCSARHDNLFKFWLADKIQKKKKIFFGTHGAGYNMYDLFEYQKHEENISKKYFIWGNRKYSSKMISVGNFLVDSSMKYSNYLEKKNYLLVLPVMSIYKRTLTLFSNESTLLTARNIELFLNNLSYKIKNKIHIRTHPQDERTDFSFLDLISLNKKLIKILDKGEKYTKISNNYSLAIFPYLSTEFLNSLTLDRPCLIYLNKIELAKFKKDARELLDELHSIGIVNFSGVSMAKNLKRISKDINKWWNDKKTIKIKKKFCYNYCNNNFDYKLIIDELKK